MFAASGGENKQSFIPVSSPPRQGFLLRVLALIFSVLPEHVKTVTKLENTCELLKEQKQAAESRYGPTSWNGTWKKNNEVKSAEVGRERWNVLQPPPGSERTADWPQQTVGAYKTRRRRVQRTSLAATLLPGTCDADRHGDRSEGWSVARQLIVFRSLTDLEGESRSVRYWFKRVNKCVLLLYWLHLNPSK